MLKKYRSTALAVSVITAMACLKYALFQGGELRPVSLAPQRAIPSSCISSPLKTVPPRWPMSNAWASGSRITPATGASPPPAR